MAVVKGKFDMIILLLVTVTSVVNTFTRADRGQLLQQDRHLVPEAEVRLLGTKPGTLRDSADSRPVPDQETDPGAGEVNSRIFTGIINTLHVYAGLYSNVISGYEVTVPQKITTGGELSFDVTHYHRQHHGRRRKRNAMPETLHYRINIAGNEEIIDLRPSSDFISNALRVERPGGKLTSLSKRSVTCHYRGTIRGQEKSSYVALSACNGLAGVLKSSKGEFWLEPSKSHNVTSGSRPHLLYRRSAVVQRHRKRKKKKKKKKFEKNCGTKEPPRVSVSRVEWSEEEGHVKIRGRRKGRVRLPRSVSKERHVETLVVADSTMMEFHQDGDVETYLLTIMNMVSAMYQDPSIGNYINVVVVKIILLEDDGNLNITVNADNTLHSFCKWQKEKNPPDEDDPYHHDVAVLITRKDICARHNAPCSTLGVAHVGGMCQTERSCNVNEDNGITLAHTITHEMGHNFGMYHDNSKSGCSSRDGKTLHVMTPSFEADTLNIAWSSCSRRDITHFLDQGLGKCLEDRPSELESYTYPELPPGAMYNADYQCRLQFGTSESSVCSPLNEICSRLWCVVDGMCTTNLHPAAPGTHCGKHMWCLNQECVPIGEAEEAIDGSWGDWGPWSACSRTCGAGVAIKERHCDHPQPAFGGKFCVGERRRYKICNTQPCESNTQSFRAQQCASYNNQPFHGKNYTWVPYFESSEPCELYCTDSDDTMIVPLGDNALDGTPCNLGTRDMCIAGICRRVGCDWVVDSDAQEDKCGVCMGDGKKCTTMKGDYTKQEGYGYTEAAIIPRGARNIHIEEVAHSKNYIAIGSASTSKYYLNGNWGITLPGEYDIAGSPALYEGQKDTEKVRIPGPITEDIMIYIIFRDNYENPGLSYEYTMPNQNERLNQEFKWEMSEWSMCSATCGGGEQVSTAVCRDTTTGNMAAPDRCTKTEKLQDKMRTCNLNPCRVRWWIGPWQLCPVTCGELALRKRTVLCVSDQGQEMALPDSECQNQPRPHDQEPCPDTPPCLTESILAQVLPHNSTNSTKTVDLQDVDMISLINFIKPRKQDVLHLKQTSKTKYTKQEKWIILPWSQCSVSCGIGFKKRTITCAKDHCDLQTKPISVKQCFRQC